MCCCFSCKTYMKCILSMIIIILITFVVITIYAAVTSTEHNNNDPTLGWKTTLYKTNWFNNGEGDNNSLSIIKLITVTMERYIEIIRSWTSKNYKKQTIQ